MTEIEYRSHPAVSRSDLWKIHESPQKYRYAKDNPAESTLALQFGQVLHKLVLEPEEFFNVYAVAPVCDRRTKEGKLAWQDFIDSAAGKTVIAADLYEQAAAMRDAVEAEPLAVKLLNGQRETEFFWTDEMTGEQCKCRVDCLNDSLSCPVIVDLKSTEDASTDGFMRHAINYGYDFQAAMYGDGVERNTGRKALFVFIAVEKKPPYAVNIFQADPLFVERGYGIYRNLLDTYHECRQTGNWYGYLGKNSQINTLSLPAWAARDMD